MISNYTFSDVSVKDMVIASSVSVCRNFIDHLFVDKMKTEEARALVDTVFCVICSKDLDEEFTVIKLWECSDNELKIFLDRHIINEKLLKRKDKAGIIINKDRTLSIIINEEDHIRIKCKVKGLNLRDAYEYINKIDNFIEEDMTYSFSETLGYLTSSISNVGTGLKADVTMHLPVMSLSGEISNITNGLNKVGMNIESLYKEGTKVLGNIYIISNQITLGVKEMEIINNIQGMVENIAKEENKFREVFNEKYKYELEDRALRSYGILKNAKILREKEILELLSYVRLGAETELLDLDENELDLLVEETRNSTIQSNSKKELNDIELDLIRADIVKQVL